MKACYDEILTAGIKTRATPEKIICELLETELAERKARSIRYRMGLAKFPVDKDLDQFNFAESPVNETQVRHLYDGNFLADHTNVIMVGGTGSGKSHLAVAIARQSIRNGGKARFFNVLDLVNQLEQEKLDSRGGKLADHLVRHDLVILDELGYLPFSKNGGQLLFHLISKLYERTSLIITTNLLCGAPHNRFNAQSIVMRSSNCASSAKSSFHGLFTPHKRAPLQRGDQFVCRLETAGSQLGGHHTL
jgi:DNA replication protein DnaC